MHKRDLVAIGSWVGLTVYMWIVAWIIAEAIPVFSGLVTLIVCLFLCHLSRFNSTLTYYRLPFLVAGSPSGSLACSGST
jgi:hypothetical protein